MFFSSKPQKNTETPAQSTATTEKLAINPLENNQNTAPVAPAHFSIPSQTGSSAPVPPTAKPMLRPQIPPIKQSASPVTNQPTPVAPSTDPMARFQRPPTEEQPQPQIQPNQIDEAVVVEEVKMEPHIETDANGNRVFKANSIKDVNFADLWYTPERKVYIRDLETKFALIPFEANDLDDFHKVLDQGYTGSSSYALKFEGQAYRVERVSTITGIQFNCRKMPTTTPSVYKLGLPEHVVKHLVSLATSAGLILFAGPTGMGKTTSASSLMREFLETHGGFLYTIEDPPEMPLDGLYHAKNGALGLCKQTPVENERWGDGLKSALRSRPRYILVGEIRTPETASQTLRAATSGHLVLSTIHANSVEDALNSMIKYASGAGLDEKLVADLLARGILAVVHQQLEGTKILRPVIHTAFANPNPLVADQMRMSIRDGKINLGTLMEAQATKLFQGKPLFKDL